MENELAPEALPLCKKLARELNKPLVFFDVETTSQRVGSPEFGIMELAYVAVMPDGKAKTFSVLINPENLISPEAAQITGISAKDVQNEPAFPVHAKRVSAIFKQALLLGFNIHSFDVKALLGQFARYQITPPESFESLDLRDVWREQEKTQKGTLSDVCSHFGVVLDGAHRALPDSMASAEVFEAMLWQLGRKSCLRHVSASLAPSKASQERNGSSDNALALRAKIDEVLATTPDWKSFFSSLEAFGAAARVSTYGISFNFRGEKISGSAMGSGYKFSELKNKISGDAPEAYVSARAPSADRAAPPAAFSKSAPKALGPSGQKNREAILECVKTLGRFDLTEVLRLAGLDSGKASQISFAASDLLASGELPPSALSIEEAQSWLSGNFSSLREASPDGKLKPMMSKAKELGAPASVDYLQLRCALALGAQQAPQRASEASSAPAPAVSSPVSAPPPEEHPFGDASPVEMPSRAARP